MERSSHRRYVHLANRGTRVQMRARTMELPMCFQISVAQVAALSGFLVRMCAHLAAVAATPNPVPGAHRNNAPTSPQAVIKTSLGARSPVSPRGSILLPTLNIWMARRATRAPSVP